MIYLEWYRDQGRGQTAADCLPCVQKIDIWPVARLVCANHAESLILWWAILRLWGVNAHTHDTSSCLGYGEQKCN